MFPRPPQGPLATTDDGTAPQPALFRTPQLAGQNPQLIESRVSITPKVRRTEGRCELEDEEGRRKRLEEQRELNSRQIDNKKAHNLTTECGDEDIECGWEITSIVLHAYVH